MKKRVTFGQQKALQEYNKEINEASLFGLVSGLIIFFICGLQTICHEGFLQILFGVLTIIGAILFLLGGFFPSPLKKLTPKLKKTTNFIGKYLLRLLLIPVYLILLILSLFLSKAISKEYEFVSWNENSTKINPKFLPYSHMQTKPHTSAVLGTLNNIFLVFAKNKQWFLLPLVILLLILGLIFFFLSSSSVFSFVYTLF